MTCNTWVNRRSSCNRGEGVNKESDCYSWVNIGTTSYTGGEYGLKLLNRGVNTCLSCYTGINTGLSCYT
jgi:hypothetical protein